MHSYKYVQGASNNIFVPRPRTEAAKQVLAIGGSHVEWPRK